MSVVMDALITIATMCSMPVGLCIAGLIASRKQCRELYSEEQKRSIKRAQVERESQRIAWDLSEAALEEKVQAWVEANMFDYARLPREVRYLQHKIECDYLRMINDREYRDKLDKFCEALNQYESSTTYAFGGMMVHHTRR